MPRSNEDAELLKTELPPGAESDEKLLRTFSYQVAFRFCKNDKFVQVIYHIDVSPELSAKEF